MMRIRAMEEIKSNLNPEQKEIHLNDNIYDDETVMMRHDMMRHGGCGMQGKEHDGKKEKMQHD